MGSITVRLFDEQLLRLRELAKEAMLTPEELVREILEEWLMRRHEDFVFAARYVLEKNAELYRRLA